MEFEHEDYATHGGVLPDNASEAFLLWASAAHAGDWDRVLKKPLNLSSYMALEMLKFYKPYSVLAAQKQAQQIAMMTQAMSRGA